MSKQFSLYFYFIFLPLLSFCTTFFLVNPVKELSSRFGFFDKPDERKQHSQNIVRLGGLCIYLGFLASLIIVLLYKFFGFEYSVVEIDFIRNILIGSTIFFLLGITDDLFRISPFVRLFFQSLTVLILSYSGLFLSKFNLLPFQNSIVFNIPHFLAIFFNVIWIAGVTNAINWLDGIDGLTAIYVSIILSSLFIISFSKGLLISAFIILIIIFALLGFYKFNKYPAKIIMGDGGAYFLGFILSTFSIFLSSYRNQSYSILLPIIFLLIPISDMAFVILRRIINSKSIFLPDRSHIHHRLKDQGLNNQGIINRIVFLVFITSVSGLITYFFIDS